MAGIVFLHHYLLYQSFPSSPLWLNNSFSYLFFNRSIARLANVTPEQLKQSAYTTPLELTHNAEWKLAKCVLQFSDVVVRILNDLYMHTLCEYLYELTTVFTDFYENCYCVEKDKTTGLISVCVIVRECIFTLMYMADMCTVRFCCMMYLSTSSKVSS